MNFQDKKNRIVFVIESLAYGGREKMVIELSNGFSKLGYDVSVITFSNDSNEQLAELNEMITLYAMPFKYSSLNGFSAAIFWIRGLFIYISYLRKIRPSIVHTRLLFQQLLFGSCGIKLSFIKTRHFHTVTTTGLYFAEKGFLNYIRLWTEKLALRINRAYIISISMPVYENCLRYFKKYAADIRCIHNGIDSIKFDYTLRCRISRETFGFNASDIIVTYVARMDEGKDHITLLKAWKEVRANASHAKLCLVGNGKLKIDLQSFVSENSLNDSVVFIDNIPYVPQVLAVTDIGAFPSLFEGFGIAIIEKMIMKIPVVATNIPVIASFIKDGEEGFLFEPKNHKMLAQKLLMLINNRQLCLKIGEKAFSVAQNYTITQMIKKHRNYYAAALSY